MPVQGSPAQSPVAGPSPHGLACCRALLHSRLLQGLPAQWQWQTAVGGAADSSRAQASESRSRAHSARRTGSLRLWLWPDGHNLNADTDCKVSSTKVPVVEAFKLGMKRKAPASSSTLQPEITLLATSIGPSLPRPWTQHALLPGLLPRSSLTLLPTARSPPHSTLSSHAPPHSTLSSHAAPWAPLHLTSLLSLPLHWTQHALLPMGRGRDRK